MKLQPDRLYLGDNGRLTHGKCSGMTAQATGNDISGQPMYRLTEADINELRRMSSDVVCEHCHQ